MSTPTTGISSLFGLISGDTDTSATTNTGTTDPFATDTISSSNATAASSVLLSASTPVLTPPTKEISLLRWHALISSATNALTNQLHLSDTQAMLLNANLWSELGAAAQAIYEKQQTIVQLSKNDNKIYQAKLSTSLSYDKNVVNPYNTFLNGISSTANAMFLLQQQYAAGTITTETYNDAVSQWNANVGDLNTQLQTQYDIYVAGTNLYNAKVTTNNLKIIEQNILREKNGITPPLPLQPTVTPAPLVLLPTDLQPGPPPPTTTVPSALPTTTGVPQSSGVSTVINVSPTTAEEQAFLDSITNDLNAINSGPIAAYNTAILSAQSQVSAMSDAIVAYQNGGSLADYTAARDAYLTFADSFNPTLAPLATAYTVALENYNLTLPAVNAQISTFNEARLAAGQAPIPYQDELPVPLIGDLLLTLDIPAGPPAPTVNPFSQLPVLLPPAPNGSSTPTTALAYTSKYFSTLFAAGLLSLKDFRAVIDSQNAYRQFLYFNLAGGKTNLFPSNAFIAPHPEINFDVKSNGAAISGVGLTSLILGLDSKALTSIISNSLFSSAGNLLNGKVIPSEVTDQAVLFALSALEKIAIASALPALSLLSGGLDPTQLNDNPVVAGALGLANLKGIEAFLDSGAVEKELTAFLINAGVSQAEIDAALPTLKAALTIGLLQFGVTQLAIALGLPGLLAQVLGNLPGADLQIPLTIGAGQQFGDVLRSGINVQNLKSVLLNELIKKRENIIDRSVALGQINKAINDTVANQTSLSNADDLRSDLARNLENQGVDPDTANDLAQRTLDFVKAEQQLPDLPTLLVKQDILKSEVMRNETFSDIISSQNLQSAINQSFAQADATKRDFRNALVAQLEQQGTERANANLISTELLRSVQSDAIKNSFSLDRVNRDTLTASLIKGNNPEITRNNSEISGINSEISRNNSEITGINSEISRNNSETTGNSFGITRSNFESRNNSNITRNNSEINGNNSDPVTAQNAANIIAATNATFALVPKTELELREILSRQLQAFNVDRLESIGLAKNAAIAQIGRDPLKSANANGFLTRDELAAQLVEELSKQFNGKANGRTVTNLATQLTLAILGPVTAPDYTADQIRRTTSVLSRLNEAYIQAKNTNVIRTDREVAADFTDFIAPKTTDSFALAMRIMDVGTSLFLLSSGIMYEGMGRKPTNYKESIDIPI